MPADDGDSYDERRCSMVVTSHRLERHAGTDFKEEAGTFLATVPAAGYEPHELEVAVAGHTVSVLGRKSSSAFGRELHLPADADPDHVTARLEDGVLHLRTRQEPALRHRVRVTRGHGPVYAEAAGN
jgi:HSP20 family molecular chaperone IbpA